MALEKGRTSPDVPWKVKLYMSMLTIAVDASIRRDSTVNRRLFNLVDFKSSASNNKPVNGVKTFDITVDDSRKLWFRLFVPTPNAATNGGDDVSLPVIVFFHGGGFAFMGADSKPCHDFCHRLSKELPAVVISVNYRLSPEHRYPSQCEDGLSVLKFLDSLYSENFPANADLNRCFLAGDSAGGNLAHHVAVEINNCEFNRLKIIGLMAIQPFFGGEERTESESRLVGAPVICTERTDWMWKAFLPNGSDRDHPAANVFGPNSVDITEMDFPATIVFVGGFDPLQDWQKRYYEGLKKRGKEANLIEYSNAAHAFYVFPELNESSLLIKDVRDFMESQSAKISGSF